MFLPCPCTCHSSCGNDSIVWARTGTGYRVESLQKKYFNLAAVFIKQYYFRDDLLLNALGIKKDARSDTNIMLKIFKIMNAGNSLLLLDEHHNSLAGVLLLQVCDKINFGRVFSYSNMLQGKVYEECINLRNSMQRKIDYFLDYNTKILMRFYLVCISDEHRGKHLAFLLFRAAIETARHLHIPIACGVFNSDESQALARKVGFEHVDKVHYDDWFELNEDELFEMPDKLHNVAVMVAKVPPFYKSEIVYVDANDKKGAKGKNKNGKEEKVVKKKK